MSLAKYSFVSWMRQGLGLYLNQVDNLGIGESEETGRSSLEVKLNLNAGDPILQTLNLVGPGDIIGIDTRNIVRVHPEPDTPNFEPNYLPFIEFYQDTFPWDYTPAKANNHNLRPWVFLLVLEESEYSFNENPNGPLDYIDLNISLDTAFPPEDQSWAFAHVHVNVDLSDDAGENDIEEAKIKLKAQLNSNPDFALSRLVSPRKLSPDSYYQAFVVPAFESGRLAGLGRESAGVDSLQASWREHSNHDKRFPIYYSWKFQTGPFGDFEYLVRLLEGRVLPDDVGYRPMEVLEEPNFNIPAVTDGVTNGVTKMGGALKPVGVSYQEIVNATDWAKSIAELINLNEHVQLPDSGLLDLAINPYSGNNVKEDPVITPPLYGKWHAIARTVEPVLSGTAEVAWLRTLNTDPRHRAAAGLGTNVIQEHQDKYMEIAWEQVGAILEANQMLRQAQLGIEIVARLYDRHITSLDEVEQLSLLSPFMYFIKCGPSTVFQMIVDSAYPLALFDPTFRYLSKPRGRVRKRLPKEGNENVAGRTTEEQSARVRPESRIGTAYKNIIRGIISPWDFIKYNPKPDGKNEGTLTFGNDPADPTSETVIDGTLLTNTPPDRNPNFGFSDPPSSEEDFSQPPTTYGNLETIEDFLTAGAELLDEFQADTVEIPFEGVGLHQESILQCLLEGLKPEKTIKDRVLIKIGTAADLDAIIPILAAPDYTEPMYKKLLEKDPNYILANIEAMPRNTITLLEANQEFIESYMVGLNHEMARELLWNEFPTDQRGSYFRQFWDVSGFVIPEDETDESIAGDLKDIKPIHEWFGSDALGQNNNRLRDDGEAPLVLAIRGEVVNRYPEVSIFAIRAHFENGKRVFNDNSEEKYPIYSADISPDITFLGFDITAEEASGNDTDDAGWFFAIKQPPAGPRFGLDELAGGSAGDISSWNDLTWQHMGSAFVNTGAIIGGAPSDDDENPNLAWGTNSADMAYILYQVPFMLAIHATEMLPD